MEDINKINVTQYGGGLNTDTSVDNQPKGTYRFALNTVNESEIGDSPFPNNEESNEACAFLKEDYIPIGKEYIGNNEVIIFSVKKDNSVSEIGILNDSCKYTTHVNDLTSLDKDKLNFKVEKQIQATYRLRNGCEKTVYFTDDFNKPRYFNFNKPSEFKDNTGKWVSSKFSLYKEYTKIPKFKSIQVLNSGGSIEPGSINIAIQYVDEGLNTTEWIDSTKTIKIYNDSTTESFLDIRGSINSDVDYKNFPTTSKSIRIELDNLDNNFAFYRLAFIEANSGNGLVNNIKYSDTIPTAKNYFVYTGLNVKTKGTEQEILFSPTTVYKAKTIEQIENRLILGNTQGKPTDFCKLQKSASVIKADMTIKKVILNNINDPRNTKNPTYSLGDMTLGGLGYQPGEIYSFGIVYVFKDGSLSPVYHIPGKNPTINPTTVFSPEKDSNNNPLTFPMSINNISSTNTYIENNSCSDTDFWGLDSEGIPLKNTPVRHHRFPLRSEVGIPLVKEESSTNQQFNYYRLKIQAVGTLVLPCTQAMIDAGQCTTLQTAPNFQIKVSYTVDGTPDTFTVNISPKTSSNPFSIIGYSNIYTSNNIVITGFEESDNNGNFTTITTFPSPKGLTYSHSIEPYTQQFEGKIYSTEIFGIKFSNIVLPPKEDTNGEEIVGYYIVRNERVESEKTILDSAVLTPCIYNSKYVSHGLLQPQFSFNQKYAKDFWSIISPEHKFNNREYTNYTNIIQEGNFDIIKRNFSKTRYNDVVDGSSYDPDIHKSGNDDGDLKDGFSLSVTFRDNYTNFKTKNTFNISEDKIETRFYLDALQSRDVNNGSSTVYNIAGDNKIGIVQTKGDLINPEVDNLPYVLLKRNLSDSYSNFRTLPYYKDSLNVETASSTKIFSGDSYVVPMRYVNSVWWDNFSAKRAGQTSAWDYIIGGLLVVIGTILLVAGGSGALVIGAGISIIGGGALFIASGVKRDALVKAYYEEYDKGLRETALDDITKFCFRDNGSLFGVVGDNTTTEDGPSDDEVRWFADCITDLWFETQVNISLRNKMTSDAPTFLDAPGLIESGNNSPYVHKEYFGLHYEQSYSRYPISKLENHVNKKLLAYNSRRRDSKEYIGHSLGEYYEINPDYFRENKQKIFYHLPLEYDCCSECKEDFPHRVHYSEQSFQEELTDNYRIFLPNNYRDIEGETGEITNIFRIGNNLFIHTREALWQMPRNYQERVTDQIVSFIGTGSYFEIPPQKVIDNDTGNSAGCQHQHSSIKTPSDYFFVSENQRKIYGFDGKSLKPISNNGISNWFQNNMRLKADEQYYNSKNILYPFRDNPSNPFGTGFIATYDTKKDRVIFTKKDFLFSTVSTNNSDFEICIKNGQLVIFPNLTQTITTELLGGYKYLGIEDCKLKFQKTVLKTRLEPRQIKQEGVLVTIQVIVSYNEIVYKYIDGIIVENPIQLNSSWTVSYSLKYEHWVSWHSYLPNFYINVPEKFFSWIYGNNNLWLHGKTGNYFTFYGKKYSWIVEYVSLNNPLLNNITDSLSVLLESKKYNTDLKEFYLVDNVFFNKAIFYNSKQCSGLLNIKVKDNEEEFYLGKQVQNLLANEIIADKNEGNWSINCLRDYRKDYNQPIWKSDLSSVQNEYYIDKVLNNVSIDFDKDWTQLQSFRDKYLVIRLIFDTFVDVKMILKFSLENETTSFR